MNHLTKPLLAALFFLLAACSSNNHNYYLLSPAGPAPAIAGMGIGVGPVTTAQYLDRPELVFQSSDNILEVSDEAEWAGELDKDFARVLSTNLGRRKNTGNLRVYPWPSDDELRYQITLDLAQFHGTASGDAVLQASWRVYSLPGSLLVHSQTSTLTESLKKDGFEALAAAQSRLIDQLAAQIAPHLK